jgi:competence protein ComEA
MTTAMLLAVLAVAQVGGQSRAASPPQGHKAAIEPAYVIDINQASEREFAKLPGIGPELARRIVAYRDKHGPFRRIEDLLAIRGIGRKKWTKIRPYLQVGGRAGEK